METSPYHQHRLPTSPTLSPVTVRGGLPTAGNIMDAQTYGTFEGNLENGSSTTPLINGSAAAEQRRQSRISVYMDLVPFAGFFSRLKNLFRKKPQANPEDDLHPQSETAAKHHPKMAGGGGNIPLEILRCLSEYFAALEDRGTVPGTSLGAMIAMLAALEDGLCGLERILTTPLPL